jgi:hypothetical protein
MGNIEWLEKLQFSSGVPIQKCSAPLRQTFFISILQCLVALHQRNAERSGTEMEERSREHFTMFSCLILHQRNTERSGTEMEVGSRKCFHCKMFYNVQLPYISVTRSGAEQRWKKGPGNILQCLVALHQRNAERSGTEMEERSRNDCGTERSGHGKY